VVIESGAAEERTGSAPWAVPAIVVLQAAADNAATAIAAAPDPGDGAKNV